MDPDRPAVGMLLALCRGEGQSLVPGPAEEDVGAGAIVGMQEVERGFAEAFLARKADQRRIGFVGVDKDQVRPEQGMSDRSLCRIHDERCLFRAVKRRMF